MNAPDFVPPSLINELTVSLTNLQASSYTCGAAMVVMLYDFILTFPDVCPVTPFFGICGVLTLWQEINYVWRGNIRKIGPAKLMFIWVSIVARNALRSRANAPPRTDILSSLGFCFQITVRKLTCVPPNSKN
jgi:hypothetical protein